MLRLLSAPDLPGLSALLRAVTGSVVLLALLAGCVPEQHVDGMDFALYKVGRVRKPDAETKRRKHQRALHDALAAEQFYVDMFAALELGLHGALRAGSLLEAVRPLLGVPYKWGGETPLGLDCSGFTQLVFRKLGVNLPRTSREQARMGVPVSMELLQPGDLVFFAVESSTIDHVGVMISRERMAHSTSRRGRVVIEPVRRVYKGKVAGARRVVRQQ